MTIEASHLTVSGIRVQIERKDIKNLHMGVYPPNGRVRVAAPLVVSNDAIRLAVIDKLGWIRRQRAKFAEQPRQSAREMVNGESHYVFGRRYRLRVHELPGKQYVALRGIASLDLFVNPGRTTEQREAVLLRWYRQQLQELVGPMVDQWQRTLGVQASAWGIKKMKTKWGSCNPPLKAPVVQPGIGQEAGAVRGVHRGPRVGPPAGTQPHRALHPAAGPTLAQLEAEPGGVEPTASCA